MRIFTICWIIIILAGCNNNPIKVPEPAIKIINERMGNPPDRPPLPPGWYVSDTGWTFSLDSL